MNQTKNMIFAFLAGTAIGALATVGVMRKIAKNDPETIERIVMIGGGAAENNPDEGEGGNEFNADLHQDKPSYTMPETLDTRKVRYDGIVTKPDIEEMAKKYENTDAEKEAAERESPEEDDEDFEEEIAESLMTHVGRMEIEETDGYGHVIGPLQSSHRDDLIYLVPEEYTGEIYPVEDLFYYEEDDVLCDVTDAPIDNVESLIGDALDLFGEGSSDPNKVYVRNCSKGFEYEVTRMEGTFGAHIYGIDSEKFATPGKQSTKRKKEEDD